MLMAATHTHAAPRAVHIRTGPLDNEYHDFLAAQTDQVVMLVGGRIVARGTSGRTGLGDDRGVNKRFQHAVHRWNGKSRIAPKGLGDVTAAIPLDDRQQHAAPVFDAGLVAATEHRVFQIAELVEQKQRMVASAAEVPVVRRAFLLSVGLAERTVHVENQFPKRLVPMDLVDPLAREMHQCDEIGFGAMDFVKR